MSLRPCYGAADINDHGRRQRRGSPSAAFANSTSPASIRLNSYIITYPPAIAHSSTQTRALPPTITSPTTVNSSTQTQ